MTELIEDFDATSLYHSATRYEKSIYSKIETGYALKNMIDEPVKKFNTGNFDQGSAFLK